MIPTAEDIHKLTKTIEKHKSKLDDEVAREVTENTLKSFIRSAVREQWMRSDAKLAFLLSSRMPDYDKSTRTKWLHKCNKCRGTFKETDVQVDHIQGEVSFTSLDDSLDYANRILHVDINKDLQILCKACHSIKSYCEANSLDWREDEDWSKATIGKKVIAICKGTGCPEKVWLTNRGIQPETNKDRRKLQIKAYLESTSE